MKKNSAKNRKFIIIPFIVIGFIINVQILYSQSIMKNGDVNLRNNEVCEDLIVVDGDVNINGIVIGTVITLSCNVKIGENSKIIGNVTFNKGKVFINSKSVLPDEIVIADGNVFVDNKKIVKSLYYINKRTRIRKLDSPISPQVEEFMREYLVFSRPLPSRDIYKIKNDKIVCCNLKLKKDLKSIKYFRLGRLANITIRKEFMKKSFEKIFINKKKIVKFRIVEFKYNRYAQKFWKRLVNGIKRIPGGDDLLPDELLNSFGDGGHWYFRFKRTSFLLWYKENYFICIEAKDDTKKSINDGKKLRNLFVNRLIKQKEVFKIN